MTTTTRRRVATIDGWAYRFYRRSDPNHHYGDLLSDVRMHLEMARHRFADALDEKGRNGNLAYTAKVEIERAELARVGRGFREIVDDVDRYENPDNWRPLGASGDFPRWLRELKNRSGAYAIRSKSTGEVLYVGESHTDRLYQTLTRHFQHWDGYTAGTTYQRGAVEVAFEVAPRDRAGRKQIDWIETLEPRDNKYGKGGDDEEIDSRDFVDGTEGRTPNPLRGHRIPRRTAQIGTVLDLVVERNDERAIYRDEVRGALLLAPEDAMDRRPGGGRLFLVRGELAGKRPIEPGDAPKAQGTHQRWHRSHGPDAIGSLDVPDVVGVPVGRAVRIGYRSDKFGGKQASYEHDFGDPKPLVYASSKARPRALVIVGGGFTVSGRGIVG